MSPSGRNILAAKEYESAGGTGFTLVTLPYEEVQISEPSDFLKSFKITLSLADKVREQTNLKINIAVGPYPILLIPLAERYGLKKAEQMLITGMEDAAKLVADGKASALGEIGRPHFLVDEDIIVASNRIMLRGMELAHENDCPVIIHCESESYTNKSLVDIAKAAGLSAEKVIKHSSPPLITLEETYGLTPSIPASRSSIKNALSKGNKFMIETDFVDDPKRPTFVMPATTVPKRINGFYQSGILTKEQIYRMCEDIPDSLYSRHK
ncbi:MAG: TatD family hydrolase [archaeon]|nr:TatD family hydrolase [archaeon]